MDEVRVMRAVIEILKCSEDEVVQKTLALKKRFKSLEKALRDLEEYLRVLEQ